MLEAVKENIPELFNFVHSAYSQPSMLFCGDQVMQSAEGVQQGDPLGPIGSVELIDSTITSKIQNLRLMGDKFRFLKSQEALSLLRHSFAIPKVLYILRTAPCFRSEQLEVFDCVLRRLLFTILNVDLDDGSAWLQATLPVRAGGLGIRRAVQLAPSAYLASAAGCSALIQEIPPLSLLAYPDQNIESATSIWHQGLSQPPPSVPESSHQRVWDAPQIEAT